MGEGRDYPLPPNLGQDTVRAFDLRRRTKELKDQDAEGSREMEKAEVETEDLNKKDRVQWETQDVAEAEHLQRNFDDLYKWKETEWDQMIKNDPDLKECVEYLTTEKDIVRVDKKLRGDKAKEMIRVTFNMKLNFKGLVDGAKPIDDGRHTLGDSVEDRARDTFEKLFRLLQKSIITGLPKDTVLEDGKKMEVEYHLQDLKRGGTANLFQKSGF